MLSGWLPPCSHCLLTYLTFYLSLSFVMSFFSLHIPELFCFPFHSATFLSFLFSHTHCTHPSTYQAVLGSFFTLSRLLLFCHLLPTHSPIAFSPSTCHCVPFLVPWFVTILAHRLILLTNMKVLPSQHRLLR